MPDQHELPPESFIPVSKFALLEYLTQEQHWENNSHDEINRLFAYLMAWRHEMFRGLLNQMKEAYLPFSPDRDTVRILEYSDAELVSMKEGLMGCLSDLLKHANFERLTRKGLERIFQENSAYGLELKVDLSEYEELMLFARGTGFDTRTERRWESLFLKKHDVEFGMYQRLFMLLKLKPEGQRIQEIMADEKVTEKKAWKKLRNYRKNLPETAGQNFIYLKLFKRIPKVELEMLFPNTKVSLKPFDKLKLGVTAGGGTGASIFATATKLTAAANPLAAAGALAGLAGVVFRQITKVISQRTKYMMLLAQKLFFHNLANNRGVLTLLVDRAEEEDVKEAILTYFFVSKNQYKMNNLERLSADVEMFLQDQFDVRVEFDGEEAVGHLINDGIITVENGVIQPLEIEAARNVLEKRWIEGMSQRPETVDEDL